MVYCSDQDYIHVTICIYHLTSVVATVITSVYHMGIAMQKF